MIRKIQMRRLEIPTCGGSFGVFLFDAEYTAFYYPDTARRVKLSNELLKRNTDARGGRPIGCGATLHTKRTYRIRKRQ